MLCRDLLQIDQLGACALGDGLSLGLTVVAQEGLGIHSADSSVLLCNVNSNPLLAANRVPLSNGGVDNKTVRRLNFELLVQEFETIARLAKLHDLDESLLSQIRNQNRNIGDRLARKMEANVGKPMGWMDVPRFKSPDAAVEYAELIHIYNALPEKERENWLSIGRALTERGPKGPNNPFGQVPRPRGPKGGTQ